MIALLLIPIAVLVLTAGYLYGRWETEAHYEPIVDELEQTIDALLPTGVRVFP